MALVESDLGMMFPMFMDQARTFGEAIAAGERVFVIAGLSHAVKIEPALRAIAD